MKKITLLFALLLVLVAGLCQAGPLPEQLHQDFKPLAGYVVKQVGEEYLVDLDAASGLKTGDILTAFGVGEEIVHPVTKEILGNLDEIKGFMRVVNIRQGYSHVLPISGNLDLEPGDVVRRYDRIPAKLVVEADEEKALETELHREFPQLDWDSDAEPLLIFDYKDGNLTVKSEFDTRQYTLQKPKPVVDKSQDSEVSAIVRQEREETQGLWHGPNLKGAAIAVTTGDFDGDGHQEIAVLLNDGIELGRFEGTEYRKVADFEISGTKPLTLESIDLNADGRDELYLVTSGDDFLSSKMLDYHDGTLKVVVDNLPWHLRKIVYPGEGAVLLGQESGKVELFSGAVFKVVRTGERLGKGASVPLPEQVNLYGFTPFKDKKGELRYAYLSPTDYLKVADAEGEILWESSDYYGGSEVRVTREDASRDEEILTFIRPRLMVNKSGEIVVTWNDGMRLMSRYRSYDESQVAALTWNGFVLQEQWRTVVQQGYLADFSFADVDQDGIDELVTLVKFKRKGLFGGARSGLVVYELQ